MITLETETRERLLGYVERHWPKKAETPYAPESVSEIALQALLILSHIARGLHNFNGRVRLDKDGAPECCWTDRHWIEFSVYGNWSTWDFNALTRFVVLCHDACIRGSIKGIAPGYMAVSFSPRVRDDSYSEGHPTMEQAVQFTRENRR